MRKETEVLHLKIMHHLSTAFKKINGVQIDNAEDLDVVIPMYNFLQYSKNYRKTTGSLWNYYRDEPSNSLSSNSESFTRQSRQILQEILIIMVLVKPVLMQAKLVKMKLKLLFR